MRGKNLKIEFEKILKQDLDGKINASNIQKIFSDNDIPKEYLPDFIDFLEKRDIFIDDDYEKEPTEFDSDADPEEFIILKEDDFEDEEDDFEEQPVVTKTPEVKQNVYREKNNSVISPAIPSRPIEDVTISIPPIVNNDVPRREKVASNIKNDNKISSGLVTDNVNKVVDKVDNVNQVSSKKVNYDSLDISKLYNFVALFMKKNGVKSSGISKQLLINEFGASNIKKLINKSYLIQLYDGTLTFNR